jgi:hypothetical protein
MDNSNSVNCHSFAHLTKEVLLQVLRQLSQQDRIGHCAATCSVLHAAAGQATEEVAYTGEIRQQQADALAAWLTRNSSTTLRQLCLGTGTGGLAVPVTVSLPWQSLRQLTSLTVRGVTVEQADCSGLGQLSLLQRVSLEELGVPTPSSVAVAAYSAVLGSELGQLVQLTELSLSVRAQHVLGGAVLAGVSNLRRLQSLNLRKIGSKECPARFQNLPKTLTALQLDWACVDDPRGGFQDTVGMLPQLQQLQVVHLSCFGDGLDAADFAALTASSCLTSLVLMSCVVSTKAARHMFRPGQLLPHLQQINISAAALADHGDLEVALDGIRELSLLVRAGEMQRIVDSCPVLRSLGTLRVAVNLHDYELLPLLQLSALTDLSIGGAGCTDTVAEIVLANMTGEAIALHVVLICTCILLVCIYHGISVLCSEMCNT